MAPKTAPAQKAAAKTAAAAPAKAAAGGKAAAAPAKASAGGKAAAAAPAKGAAAPKAAAPAAPKVEKKAAAGTSTSGVYVKNWGQGSVADATTIFSAAGKVASARIRRGKFAIVYFESAAGAKKAIDMFNGKLMLGTTVTVTAAKASPKAKDAATSATVFVGPVFRSTTSRKQLYAFFGGMKVKRLRMYHQNYALVFFESAAVAAKAVAEKNGAVLNNKTLIVKPSARSLETIQKRAAQSKALVQVHAWKKTQNKTA